MTEFQCSRSSEHCSPMDLGIIQEALTTAPPLPPPVALPSLTNRQPRALSHASEHPSPEGRRRGTATNPRHTFPRVHHRLRFRCLREARGYKHCRLTTAARRLSAPLAQQLATVSQEHERRRAIVTLACVSLRPRPRHALRCLRRSLRQTPPRPTASAHRLELARQDFSRTSTPAMLFARSSASSLRSSLGHVRRWPTGSARRLSSPSHDDLSPKHADSVGLSPCVSCCALGCGGDFSCLRPDFGKMCLRPTESNGVP